jgi:hypothetical protein
VSVRDSVEHLRADNIYQGGDTDWDKVPLAWILSEGSIDTYMKYAKWLELVLLDWKAWQAAKPGGPMTLTVQLGMGSMYPLKQPC